MKHFRTFITQHHVHVVIFERNIAGFMMLNDLVVRMFLRGIFLCTTDEASS